MEGSRHRSGYDQRIRDVNCVIEGRLDNSVHIPDGERLSGWAVVFVNQLPEKEQKRIYQYRIMENYPGNSDTHTHVNDAQLSIGIYPHSIADSRLQTKFISSSRNRGALPHNR